MPKVLIYVKFNVYLQSIAIKSVILALDDVMTDHCFYYLHVNLCILEINPGTRCDLECLVFFLEQLHPQLKS